MWHRGKTTRELSHAQLAVKTRVSLGGKANKNQMPRQRFRLIAVIFLASASSSRASAYYKFS
jgi:hypothetical protein